MIWTDKDDNRYAELLKLLSSVEEPSNHFSEQCELVSLRNKALFLGMLVDPLPF